MAGLFNPDEEHFLSMCKCPVTTDEPVQIIETIDEINRSALEQGHKTPPLVHVFFRRYVTREQLELMYPRSGDDKTN